MESSYYVLDTLLDGEDTNGTKPTSSAPGTHSLCCSLFPWGESPISPLGNKDASRVQNSFRQFQGPRCKHELQNQAAWKGRASPRPSCLWSQRPCYFSGWKAEVGGAEKWQMKPCNLPAINSFTYFKLKCSAFPVTYQQPLTSVSFQHLEGSEYK